MDKADSGFHQTRTLERLTALLHFAKTPDFAHCGCCIEKRPSAPNPSSSLLSSRAPWLLQSYVNEKEGNCLFPELTERRDAIPELIADGLSKREIACILSISESRVENHTHQIYEKLGVASRTQAVTYAYRRLVFSLTDMLENKGNPS